MGRLKKYITKFLDIIELYIPMALFSAVFIMYIIMILYRYILHKAVFEMNELCQVLYLSCAMLGASYAGRSDSHVIFPLLYDKLHAKGQKILRMIGDVIVCTLCGMLWWPCMKSAIWMARKKTEVLDISFGWIYAVFMIFITLSAIYYFYNFIKDLKTPAKKKEDEIERALEDKDKT
jgi:TRAP-type C4-dicarboxylate transport system permease small subunit